MNHGYGPVFGRNFDWLTGHGSIFINKRGISKTAQSYNAPNPFTWVSKYGNATFNQQGREFPYGGMNEAGLVVETMMLRDTEYPQSFGSRHEIGLFQWIQYQLDSFSTIEEVIKSNSEIGIKAHIGAHFLVSDAAGDCVTIEFLKGKLVYHTREKLPVKVLSNSKYSEAVSFWEKGQAPENDPRRSIGRFILAANMVGKYDPKTKPPVDYAFKILSSVANPQIVEEEIQVLLTKTKTGGFISFNIDVMWEEYGYKNYRQMGLFGRMNTNFQRIKKTGPKLFTVVGDTYEILINYANVELL